MIQLVYHTLCSKSFLIRLLILASGYRLLPNVTGVLLFIIQVHDASNVNRDAYTPNPSCRQFAKYEWIGVVMGGCLRSGREHLVSGLSTVKKNWLVHSYCVLTITKPYYTGTYLLRLVSLPCRRLQFSQTGMIQDPHICYRFILILLLSTVMWFKKLEFSFFFSSSLSLLLLINNKG